MKAIKWRIVGAVMMAGAASAQETSPTVDEAVAASRLLVVAWKCGTFAHMSRDDVEAQRLFDVGYSAGQTLLSLDLTGTGVTWDEFLQRIPASLSRSIGAPSVDFQLGRWHQMMQTAAFDRVIKTDVNGRSVGPEDYVPHISQVIE